MDDGFQAMVKDIWERPVAGNTPILRWNNKMRVVRKHFSGWASHVADILKKESFAYQP
jgi:hypothetical protein